MWEIMDRGMLQIMGDCWSLFTFVNSLVVEKIDGGNKSRLGEWAGSRVLFR